MTKTVTVESITPMSSPLNIIKDTNGNSNGTNSSDIKDKNNQILSSQAYNNSVYNDVMNIFSSDSSLTNDNQMFNLGYLSAGANGSDPTFANLNTNPMDSFLPLYSNLNDISLNMEDTFSANTNNFISTTDTISAQPTDNQNSSNAINTSSANELNPLESGKTDHLDLSQFIDNDFLFDQSSTNISITNAMSTSTSVTAAATATTATTSAAAVISTTTAQTTTTNTNLTKSNSLNNINTTNANTSSTTTSTVVNPTTTNPTTTAAINTTTTTTAHPTSINNFIPSNVSLIGNQTSLSITSSSATVPGVASVATVPSTSISSTNELSNISNKSNTTATNADMKINNNTIIPSKSNKSETSKSTSLSSSVHNIEGGYHGISNISPFTKTGVVNPTGVSTSTLPSSISSSMPMVTDSHASTQKSKTNIGSVSSSVSSVVATTPKSNVIKSSTATTTANATSTIASTTNTTNIMNTTTTTTNTTLNNNTNTNTITNTNKSINNSSSIQGNVLSSVTSSGTIGSTVTLTKTPRNAATSAVHIQRNMSQGPYVTSQVPMASPVQVQMLSHPPTPVQSMGVSMAQPPTPSQTMRYSPMMASQTRTAIPIVQGQGQALRGPGPLPNGTVIQQPHGQQRFVVANGQPHPQTQPIGQPISQQVQQIQQIQHIQQVPQVQQVQQNPQTIPQHQTNFIPQQQNVGIPTASPAPSTGQIQVQRVQTPAQTPGQLPGQLPSQVSGQVQVQGQIPGQQIVQQPGTPYILNGKAQPQPQPSQPQTQPQTQSQAPSQSQSQPQTQPQTQPQQPQQTAFVVANNSNANSNPGTIVNAAVPHQTPTQPAQRVVNGTVQQIPIQQVLPSPGTQPNPQQNIQAQVGTPQGQAIALGQGQGQAQGQTQGQSRGQAITTIQGSITAMPTPPQQSSVYASNVNGTPNLQSNQSIKQATPNLPVQGQIPNQAMFSPMSQQQNKINKVISNPVAQPQQQINVAAQQAQHAQQQKSMMANVNVPGAAVHTMISPIQKNGTFATTAIQGIPVQTANGQRIVVQQAPGQPPSQPIIIQQQPQAAIQAFRMPGQQVILNQPQAHPVQGQPQPVIIQQQPTQQVQMIPQQVQVIQHPPAGAIPIQNIPMSTLQQQPQQIQRIAYPANVAQPMQMAQVQQPQQIQFQQGQPQMVQQIGPNGQIFQITRNPTFIQQPGPGMPQQPQAVRMVQIPGQPGQPTAYQVQPSQVIFSNPGQQQAQVQAISGMNPMTVVQPQAIALVNGQPQPGTPSNDKIMKGMNPTQQRSPFVQLSNISKSLKDAKGSPYMNAKFTSATSAAMNTITLRKESPSIKTGITAASPLVNVSFFFFINILFFFFCECV